MRLLVQRSPLAGFQYDAGAAVWEHLCLGDRLALVREAENPHDANAVRVAWRIAALTQHKNPWRRLRIDVFVVF